MGTRFSPAGTEGLPLIVVASPSAEAMGWLASHLASRLPAVVYTCASSPGSPGFGSTLRAVRDDASHHKVDVTRLGIVAEDAAADDVLRHCANSPGVTRLALVSPLFSEPLPGSIDGLTGFPPTLLQYARGGASAAACAELETRLRGSAVAVRAIDYSAPQDGWTRRSRVRKGSDRGLDDLVGFFARGLGSASTFEVIPGWDLH